MLQQYLPFTVLKLETNGTKENWLFCVATVLTVYGIETGHKAHTELMAGGVELQQYLPFTVLKQNFRHNL